MMPEKTIAITGASSGIGRGLALSYAAAGRKLILFGRDQERLAKVQADCLARGAEVVIAVIAVEDQTRMQTFLLAQDDQRPIDCVIANAGISRKGAQAHADAGREVLQTNVLGVLNTIEPLIPRMRARQHGRIVLMASMAGYYGFSHAPAYCASKAYIRSLGQSLRPMLVKDSVKVNVICPGFIDTPLIATNEFPTPFKMSVDKAVAIMRAGLGKNKPVIAFPLTIVLVLKLLNLLPARLADRLTRHL